MSIYIQQLTTAYCEDCETEIYIGSVTPKASQSFMPNWCPDCGEAMMNIFINKIEEEAYMQTVREELLKGNKVGAIREYRKATGKGLRDSKNFVEAMPEHELYKQRQQPGAAYNAK